MQIDPGNLELMTWREFDLRSQGYFMRYQRQRYDIRFLAATIINSQPGREELIRPEQLFPLPDDFFDDQNQIVEYTPEEWATEQERLKQEFEKRGL